MVIKHQMYSAFAAPDWGIIGIAMRLKPNIFVPPSRFLHTRDDDRSLQIMAVGAIRSGADFKERKLPCPRNLQCRVINMRC